MTPLVLCTLTLIVTLAVSGLAKVKEPTSTVTAIINLKLDQWLPVKPVAKILPWGELALAAALLLLPGVLQVLAASTAVLLFAGYWGAIARAVVQGNTASCNCFGGASTAPVSMFTLIRNTALLMAAFGALIGALATGGSALTMLLATNADGWLWIIGAALAALTLWAIYRSELVAPETGNSTEAAAEAQEVPLDEEGDYMRTPIPYAAIRYPASAAQEPNKGTSMTLRELSSTQARLLFWVSPTCGGCYPVIEQLDTWQKQLPMLGIHPVLRSEENLAQLDLPADLQPFIDPDFETGRLFGSGTPAAVALGMDGLLAGGPVRGTNNVVGFVDEIIAEFAEAAEEAEMETAHEDEAMLPKLTDGKKEQA